MAGVTVPVVMFPRYSCYSGADTFYTMPMDVAQYSNVLLNVWRSAPAGTAPTYTLTFEESTDTVNWTAVAQTGGGSLSGLTPAASTETQYSGDFTKRWFRLKLVLGGTSPVFTCWAVGFLIQRQV